MTGAQVTCDGADDANKTCGGCGGLAVGDGGEASTSSRTAGGVVDSSGARRALKQLDQRCCNQPRGLLAEFGFVFTGGAASAAAPGNTFAGNGGAYCGFQGCSSAVGCK